MILRTDPASRRAALLSLPRDLFVPIPGTGTSRRINIAIEQGGAPLLIRTIGENFGIPIHHYVQVDFASFRGLVEAIDGVPIYVPARARRGDRSRPARRRLPHAGPDRGARLRPLPPLRGADRLAVGRGPRSDIGRIARQQDFIRRALSRAIDRGARNPGTLDQLIDVGLSGITVDSRLTAGDIFDLGTRFRSFDPDNLQTYSVSGTPDVVNGAAVLRLIEGPETEATLAIFRGGTTGELSPASVRLTVHNGTGVARQGADAAAAVQGAGFNAAVAGDEPGGGARGTVVRFPPGQEVAADLIARWLVGGATLEPTPGAAGIDLVTGTDWQGVRETASPSSSTTTVATLPPPTTASTAPPAGGGTASSAQTTTSIDLSSYEC